MADTDDNQSAYPQQSMQEAGLGFPICRIVGITCLSSGVLKDAAVGHYQGKGGDEQSLLRSLQDTFKQVISCSAMPILLPGFSSLRCKLKVLIY